MNWNRLILSSFTMMVRYKLRTFLMSIGVVLGVAALVVMRSYGAGAEQEMMEKVNRMFSASSLYLQAGKGGMAGDPAKPATSLTLEDLTAIQDQLPTIQAWDPLLVTSANIGVEGLNRSTSLWSNGEQGELVWGRSVVSGEFFSKADIASASRVALLGDKTALYFFGERDPVGLEIRIDGNVYRVKGVLEPIGTDPHGMDRDDEVHIPISTMMRRVKNVDYISGAKILVKQENQVEETVAGIHQILMERHVIQDHEDRDYSLITPEVVRWMVARMNRVFKVFLPVAACLALLVASLVIANIMLMTVKERVPEIGLRKAIGATNPQIAAQFLLETFSVTVMSGLIGILLGLAVMAVMSEMASLKVIISPSAIILGLAAAVVSGMIAGYLPARKAARMDPVEALR